MLKEEINEEVIRNNGTVSLDFIYDKMKQSEVLYTTFGVGKVQCTVNMEDYSVSAISDAGSKEEAYELAVLEVIVLFDSLVDVK